MTNQQIEKDRLIPRMHIVCYDPSCSCELGQITDEKAENLSVEQIQNFAKYHDIDPDWVAYENYSKDPLSVSYAIFKRVVSGFESSHSPAPNVYQFKATDKVPDFGLSTDYPGWTLTPTDTEVAVQLDMGGRIEDNIYTFNLSLKQLKDLVNREILDLNPIYENMTHTDLRCLSFDPKATLASLDKILSERGFNEANRIEIISAYLYQINSYLSESKNTINGAENSKLVITTMESLREQPIEVSLHCNDNCEHDLNAINCAYAENKRNFKGWTNVDLANVIGDFFTYSNFFLFSVFAVKHTIATFNL